MFSSDTTKPRHQRSTQPSVAYGNDRQQRICRNQSCRESALARVEGLTNEKTQGRDRNHLSRKGIRSTRLEGTMKTPVRYCTICKTPIDHRRVMRASAYCSDDCRRLAKKEMRQLRAEKACRLCGRPPLKKKPKKAENSQKPIADTLPVLESDNLDCSSPITRTGEIESEGGGGDFLAASTSLLFQVD